MTHAVFSLAILVGPKSRENDTLKMTGHDVFYKKPCAQHAIFLHAAILSLSVGGGMKLLTAAGTYLTYG